MKTPPCLHLFRILAIAGLALTAAGCGTNSSSTGSGGSGGSSDGRGGSGTGGTISTGTGGTVSTGTGGTIGTGTGGTIGTGTGGTIGTGGGAGHISGTGTGGTTASGTGGTTTSGTGGIAGMTGSGGTGGTSNGGASITPDLIGPGGATCGNVNATHDDGWMCILSAPKPGTNVVGAWFDYAYPATTSCTHTLKKPSGTTRQICYSGGNCASTSAGAGLGFSICDVHGVDVSTWPEMKNFITTNGLSTTGKSPFSACNTGAKISSVTWTLGSGSTPAGMSVVFQDVSDTELGRVANVPAGATSVSVPATVDTSKIASIHFTFGGGITTWNFCLSTVKISY